jgi:hypothetical protein
LPLWLIDVLDEEHPDVGWQPPAKLPTVHDLRDAIARCNATIEGRVTPAFAKQCFAKMAMAFEPNTKLTGDETRLRLSVWLEACGDLNDALWADATGEAIRALKWMPKPSEFRELVASQLTKARQRRERLRKMLDGAAKPAVVPFVKESATVRLRAMRDSFRKHGDDVKAASYERSLAMAENREAEGWAMAEIVAPTSPPAAKAPPREPLPQSREATIGLLQARIRFFRDMGMLDYVSAMERELAELEQQP